jgi:uncharacterized protein
MRINATQGKQGIGTEVKDTTYVEAARWGKHRRWRYLLGLVVILFAWSPASSSRSRSADSHTALSPVGRFLYIMAGFPFFLAEILLTVSLDHRRPLRTLITARKKISWHRVGHGFVAWFVPFCLVGDLVSS